MIEAGLIGLVVGIVLVTASFYAGYFFGNRKVSNPNRFVQVSASVSEGSSYGVCEVIVALTESGQVFCYREMDGGYWKQLSDQRRFNMVPLELREEARR